MHNIKILPKLRCRDINIMRVQLRSGDFKFPGLLDTGCSLCIIDISIYEKIYASKPEMRKYKLSSRGSPGLCGAFGERLERIQGLVTLPIYISTVTEEIYISST